MTRKELHEAALLCGKRDDFLQARRAATSGNIVVSAGGIQVVFPDPVKPGVFDVPEIVKTVVLAHIEHCIGLVDERLAELSVEPDAWPKEIYGSYSEEPRIPRFASA